MKEDTSMKKTYKTPLMGIVRKEMLCRLLSGSDINGGGNKGAYQEYTQESHGSDDDFDYDD